MNRGYVLAHLRLALQAVEHERLSFPEYTAQHLNDLIRKIESRAT